MADFEKKLKDLERGLQTFTRIVRVIGQVVLMAMVALTVLDVVLRRVFNRPLAAGLELSEIMLVVVVLSSVAYCGMEKGHVTIDTLTYRLRSKIRRLLRCLMDFLSFLLFIAMGWGSIVLALDKLETHSVTGILPIPVYPFVFWAAFCSLLLAVILFFQFCNSVLRMVLR